MSGLHINNVSHEFDGLPVVRGVSVFVAPGEMACLLGPSGCGKTTLLRVAAGLERLQRGQVRIGEEVVADAATGLIKSPVLNDTKSPYCKLVAVATNGIFNCSKVRTFKYLRKYFFNLFVLYTL